MEREITDSNGITWVCIQAYSGISHNAENQDAAQVKGQEDSYWVVPGEKFTFHKRRSKGIMLKQKTDIASRLRRRHLLGMFLVGITGAIGSACTTNSMERITSMRTDKPQNQDQGSLTLSGLKPLRFLIHRIDLLMQNYFNISSGQFSTSVVGVTPSSGMPYRT